MYNIIRFYKDAYPNKRVIARGLTLSEAQAYCSNSETSSATATSSEAKRRTKKLGGWFDGYIKS